MEITETYRMAAPPERVWSMLMDPEVIRECMPGCGALVATGEDRYKATLTVALAAISGTYEGTIVLSDKASITLHPDGSETVVNVAGQVHTGGPIARLGQRLVANVSKMMQDRFFANLQRHV